MEYCKSCKKKTQHYLRRPKPLLYTLEESMCLVCDVCGVDKWSGKLFAKINAMRKLKQKKKLTKTGKDR